MNKRQDLKISKFSVGDFCITPSRNLITIADDEVTITPKMLAVLIELAKHQGETLSKEQLIIAVWGSLYTSDMVLSRAISDLRKAFGDSAKQQNYIETVTKQGYRLKQPVNWQTTSPITTYELPIKYKRSLLVRLASNFIFKATSAKKRVFIALLMIFVISGYWFIHAIDFTYFSNVKNEAELTYLTENSDSESYVRFSADGKYLAYSTESKSVPGRRLKLHSLVNNKITSIGGSSGAMDDSYDLSPAFSADGKELAYKHLTMESCFIRIVNLTNWQERQLTECPFSKSQGLDWSPDGKQLITTVFNHIKKIESLALIDIDSGQLNILTAPFQRASGHIWPRFSPDGKSLAVVHIQPNNNVWALGLVDVNSGVFSEILSLGEDIGQVVWDETGSYLFYSITKGVNSGIWKVNLTSKQSQLVAHVKGGSFDFNKEINKFAFVEKNEEINIWKSLQTDSDGVKSERLLKNLPQSNFPSLSPKNKMLAFVSTSSGTDSLWIRNLNDNSDVLVFRGNTNEKLSEPTWSPDGKQLLINVLSKNSSKMAVLDLKLGVSSLFPSENNVKMGKWSQDGSMMYWYEEIDDNWHIMEKNLTNNQKRIILTQAIFRFELPDKNNLHYQRIGTVKVHSRNLSTVEDKILLALEDYHTWDAHLDAIYYVSHSLNKNKLMLFRKDMFTNISEELYPIDSMLTLSGRHLSVSNDGNTAYYTRIDKSNTDIALINIK